MCYFIHGALFGKVDEDAYQEIVNKYAYKIRCGTKHSVKMSVLETSQSYRVTKWCCDCDSALGKEDPDAEEIKELAALFRDIQEVEGAKHIYLCRTWAGCRNKRELKLKLDEIDIEHVLAQLDAGCLYTFVI